MNLNPSLSHVVIQRRALDHFQVKFDTAMKALMAIKQAGTEPEPAPTIGSLVEIASTALAAITD